MTTIHDPLGSRTVDFDQSVTVKAGVGEEARWDDTLCRNVVQHYVWAEAVTWVDGKPSNAAYHVINFDAAVLGAYPEVIERHRQMAISAAIRLAFGWER